MMHSVFFVLCLVLLECTVSVRADDPACYSSGSIAGIVIATIVVTLVMGGLAAAFIWYLWKQRKVGYSDNKSLEKPIVCPPMSPDKQMIARESNDYAFDNPYFKDDETDHASPDAAEKGESGFRKDNGDIAAPVQNSKTSYEKLTTKSLKASNGTTANNHHKKSRPFSSLPFHAVFHPSGKKQQRATMDDTYISKHLERITVPLRGHDFTGLGFNICGNMRDGIFVKDVLHRGPASESGKIKAGDRIVGVTVSFAAMVYEDALTILSYASPYDVRLEIEKAPATSTGPHLPPSSPKRIGASTSFRNNGQRRLFHPLYRSQSIDDLTQIGKDGFGTSMNTSGSQRESSSSSATPKRSQSVEASNVGMKARPAFILKPEETKSSSSKGSRKSSTSSCESTVKAVTPTEKSQPVSNEEVPCTKKETKSARFRAELVNVTTEASSSKALPPAKPARDLSEDKQFTGRDDLEKPCDASVIAASDIPKDDVLKPETSSSEGSNGPDGESDAEKPTAPPRKASTPKRKAPAPPPAVKTETSAVVHRADDVQQELQVPATDSATRETSVLPPPPPISDLPPVADETLPTTETKSFISTHELHLTSNEMPVFSSVEKITEPGLGSSDTSSLASADHSTAKMEKDDQNASPGKRKASSLGDLTKLEQGASKKTSTSSAILERAVSLDLQQSIPGENLTRQKKILRVPAFEDDYLEDREDLTEINGQGLKRWDDGLDKVFARLPNGEANSNQNLSNEEDNSSAEIGIKAEINHKENTKKLGEETITDSSTEKSSADLEDDSPVNEIPPPMILQESATILTSTPVKRVIEVKNLQLDNSDDDDNYNDIIQDVPYLASAEDQKNDESPTKYTVRTTSNSTTLFSPVTISIPVIKPDLTHFEKLPSPPPASTHPGLDSSWRMSKTISIDDSGKPSLEKISVQSLYKPIFSSKEINSSDEPIHQISTEKMVNGNESDTSEHYSTAHENTSTSSMETSSLSVTLSTKEVTKTPNTIAGFAKTLIIPGPNEVENLLSLAAEPITPPPALEPPAKPVEHE